VDECGNNALHAACSAGHFEIVKAITATGCDPKARNLFGNDAASLSNSPQIRAYLTRIAAQERCADSGVGMCFIVT
jgi:ankyrin repeat protein